MPVQPRVFRIECKWQGQSGVAIVDRPLDDFHNAVVVAEGCRIPPLPRLRMENHVVEDVVAIFVEFKVRRSDRSVLHEKKKAVEDRFI